MVAQLGMPHAEPFTFLSLRFVATVLLMGGLAAWLRAPWPGRALAARIALAGCLLQAGYLGGVWAAARAGLDAGPIALLMGLQPLLTGMLSPLLLGAQARPSLRQWVGLAAGLLGVALVIGERLGQQLETATVGAEAMAWALLGLASITAGTLYQRQACPSFDLRTGSVIQFSASAAITIPLALMLETRELDWGWELGFALGWSVLGLSIGAISLLFLLIRAGTATQVSSLLYLTPACTALMAWLFFGAAITPPMLVGFVITALAVWWATSPTPSR